ncbi:hypothetical protein HBI23_205770 [Parastagonospora nodorum]|nr:hypothetical protein HBI47_129210 [Parastagonospora nodorum]KAH5637962.1 hypothetical protein HBI23_205770 [Parastagonospora nodorum]KAH6202954.1 hypothetical protein HBI43_210420 [Parastagonospora nodorum]KAH6243982.1 hypothetical protein HBI42_211180 [Parastagonospora nodorum]
MASPADAGTPSSQRRDSEQPEDGSNKKRRTGPNSRGVANLTPEQLARKRANDREAQRAIRERTKNQIDRLNQRIRDLENQQPYHDLQVVLREKEAVQAENADIRKRLHGVMTLIQPILRDAGPVAGLNELAAAAERSPLTVLPPHRDAPIQPPSDPRQFHATLQDMAAGGTPTNGVHSPSVTDPGRPWMYPGEGPTSHMRRYSNDNSPRFDAARPQITAPDMPFDERLGVDFLLDNNQARVVDPNLPPPQLPQPYNVSSDSQAQYAPNLVAHLTLPRNSSPTCPLDAILLTFLQDRQTRAAEGVPIKTLVGPLYPNFTSLVYPERQVESHPLSQLFTEILRTFPDICGKPEQVAIVFIMYLVMRWQIDPSQENYDRLPHWVTPRPTQLFVGHPCWFDHLPWPRLRDRLCLTKPFLSFQNFFIPFTTTVSLNWPYEPQDVLLPASKVNTSALSVTSSSFSAPSTHVHPGSPQDPATPQPPLGPLPKEEDQWLINPAFESHLRDLGNWTLGPSFRGTFPQFADCVKIKEGR